MKWSRIAAAFAGVAIASSSAAAQIQTFEDYAPCANNTVGVYGFVDYMSNWVCYGFVQPPYTPHTDSSRVYTFDPTGKFVLTSPQIFDGAWFAGNGSSTVMFSLYLAGANVANSAILLTSATPTYLPTGYAGLVDEIHVNSLEPDFYIMDDVTFNGAVASTPEPGTVALMATGFFALAGAQYRRRKTRK